MRNSEKMWDSNVICLMPTTSWKLQCTAKFATKHFPTLDIWNDIWNETTKLTFFLINVNAYRQKRQEVGQFEYNLLEIIQMCLNFSKKNAIYSVLFYEFSCWPTLFHANGWIMKEQKIPWIRGSRGLAKRAIIQTISLFKPTLQIITKDGRIDPTYNYTKQ